eukprot:TRINITY_DN4398_c0_g1_i16.p2 TRINITY_DN4398_c0_g1~~TRINITY_DN4398_c0_g1_i16.p2  ORF type:complete len:117 (-),score=17.73 TRINITY_DN4398_c0_g1_i16:121-471(-)
MDKKSTLHRRQTWSAKALQDMVAGMGMEHLHQRGPSAQPHHRSQHAVSIRPIREGVTILLQIHCKASHCSQNQVCNQPRSHRLPPTSKEADGQEVDFALSPVMVCQGTRGYGGRDM